MMNPYFHINPNFKIKPILKNSMYPCQASKKESEPELICRQINHEHEGFNEMKENKTNKKIIKKKTCEEQKISTKIDCRKFEEKICALPFSRPWIYKGMSHRPVRKHFQKISQECPRPLDEYELKSQIPVCKPQIKEPPDSYREPIGEGVCVFCLKTLYKGGFIYDLFQRVPYIKKQSEEYGDEIGWRIGIRTRITVHKKCFMDYIDRLNHKQENAESKVQEVNVSESENDFCGEEKKESEEEIIDVTKTTHQNQFFCLKKFKPPKVNFVFHRTRTDKIIYILMQEICLKYKLLDLRARK